MFIFIFYGKLLEKLGFKKKYHTTSSAWGTHREGEEDGESVNCFFRRLFGCLSIALISGMFIFGAINANDPNECRVHKIADTIITAPYALGCNLFKDRFNIKLN